MKLSHDQVKKVAKLANLPLSALEEDKYAEQLSAILDYIELLNSVDSEEAGPTFNATDKSNILAKDETKESLSQAQALQDASGKKEGFFVTKGIFEEV